ncbi:protein phosphatase 2C domain-containing protein [Bacillus canaveralius]|uniref:protein phosphatase 2C domain-containing protein n=1 Tax=Bacillus canaveralius TaxID=1403243 RepID=UPI000F7935F6|nr:protein phosphatase 2C domain-containing protein [Bacillus canaveralius]RSK52075.1 protein phosphatase 2C domain-containing protein [Bacillus canaveralius]
MIYSWVGSQSMFLDECHIETSGPFTIGRNGGATKSGAYKNEDGFLLSFDENGRWEFAVILDAHNTAQSAELIVSTIHSAFAGIDKILNLSTIDIYRSLENYFLNLFGSDDFLESCRSIKGESACLICVRRDHFLWWFSVGDCVLLLLHDDFKEFGQAGLNQRNFYEWIGKVNTFDLDVPCFSSGVRELRKGQNDILLLTDGSLEPGVSTFLKPTHIYETFYKTGKQDAIEKVLKEVVQNNISDSATIIAWEYHNPVAGALPSW